MNHSYLDKAVWTVLIAAFLTAVHVGYDLRPMGDFWGHDACPQPEVFCGTPGHDAFLLALYFMVASTLLQIWVPRQPKSEGPEGPLG